MDREHRREEHERDEDRERELAAGDRNQEHDDDRDRDASNPPRTTTGDMTAPKFGSATSGGGEFEPGPERD